MDDVESGGVERSIDSTAELARHRTVDTRTSHVGEDGLIYKLILARTRAGVLGRAEDPVMVGQYRIECQIGAGGMGVVYAAFDEGLDRKVAIKLLHADMASGSDGPPRLLREAQAMARLSHPNVAQVYQVGIHDEKLFVAMEMIDGVTLRDWGHESKPWPEVVAMHVKAGWGLAAAHAAGLIHRDYKLDNVLVGRSGRPRVLDFGLARPENEFDTLQDIPALPSDVSVDDETSVDLTATGTILGTPAYMAPEQLRGEEVDARADQFSFCVALFEGLYGKRPFPGGTLSELIRSVLHREPLEVEDNKKVPKAVRTILLRGLQREPADRYPSMRVLLHALQSSLDAAQTPWHRRWLPWTAGALSVGALGYFALGGEPTPPSAEAPQATVAAPDSVAPPEDDLLTRSHLPKPMDVPDPADPAQLTIHRLDNGLTVYIAPRPVGELTEAHVLVRSDVRDERPGQEGFSAGLIDMVEMGSDRFNALDFDAERPKLEAEHAMIDELASVQGDEERAAFVQKIAEFEETATTNNPPEFMMTLVRMGVEDMGAFGGLRTENYARMPHNAIGGWLQVHAELLRRPVFRAPVGALARSIYMLSGYVWRDAAEHASMRAFGTNAASYDPESVAKNLHRIPLDELKKFHDAYYRPNNTALLFIGPLTAEELLPQVRDAFGTWEPAEIPERLETDYTALPGRRTSTVTQRGPEKVLVSIPIHGLDEVSLGELYAFAWSCTSYDGLITSTLKRDGKLRSARPVVEGGVLRFHIKPTSGQTTKQAEDAFFGGLADIAAGRVSDEDWAAAMARQRYAASGWSASPRRFADLISDAFLEGREWSEVVEGYGKPVPPRRLQEIAAALLEAPTSVVHTKRGPREDYSALMLPRTRTLRPEIEKLGEFASGLVEQAKSAREPQFLVEGRNFRRTRLGQSQATLVQREGPRFFVRLSFATGAATDAWACDALRAKVNDAKRERILVGTNLRTLCAAGETRLTIEGLDEQLEVVWPAVLAWLADTTVPDASQSDYVHAEVVERKRAEDADFELVHGLALHAILGPEALTAHLPSNEEFSKPAPGRMSQALQALNRGPLRVAYVGPRTDLFASLKMPESGNGEVVDVASLAEEPTKQQRIFVIDAPDMGEVDVRIAIRGLRPTDALERILARLVAVGVPTTPPAGEGAKGLWYYGLEEGEGVRARRRDLYTYGYRGNPGVVAAAVEAGIATSDNLSDLVTLRRTGHAVEKMIRDSRFRAASIPTIIDDWAARGLSSDPIIEQWMILPQVTEEQLRAYTDALAEIPPTITVVGPKSKLDLAGLRKLGTVEFVDPERVVRDTTSGEYFILGYWNEEQNEL